MSPGAIPRSPRILSIQSHVVSGYCGNKSATFPLQMLGFEVDVINSVQLSNHTQYKVTKGQIFTSKDLEQLHAGLKENDLLKLYDCILTGYVADVSYIESMAKLIADVKAARRANHQECFYTLDPVLGDDGPGYYVPNGEKIAEAYKRHLLPLADVMTPNRFEASILSGVEIDPLSSNALELACKAINVLHQRFGVKVVVITSLEIETTKGQLVCLISRQIDSTMKENGEVKNGRHLESINSTIWALGVPKLACPFTGTGDLFTALLSGWLFKTNFDIKQTLEKTANAIHEVLVDTLAWFHQVDDQSVQSHELRLVQNRNNFIQPSDRFKAFSLCTGGDKETRSLSTTLLGDRVKGDH